MSVIIYIEHTNGIIKKNALEAASYGVAYAEKMGSESKGIVIGTLSSEEIEKVGSVGLEKVINVNGYDYLNHQKIASIVSDIASSENAKTIIFCGSSEGKSAGSRLAVKLNAGIITEVVDLPSSNNPITLKKKAFSGKGFASIEMVNDKNIIVVSTNAFGVKEKKVNCSIENQDISNDDDTLKH